MTGSIAFIVAIVPIQQNYLEKFRSYLSPVHEKLGHWVMYFHLAMMPRSLDLVIFVRMTDGQTKWIALPFVGRNYALKCFQVFQTILFFIYEKLTQISRKNCPDILSSQIQGPISSSTVVHTEKQAFSVCTTAELRIGLGIRL